MAEAVKRNRRTAEQALAADPAENVWVEASAGTGKTQVLTDRILRLLLAGVRPGRILALTFTKAAAAEMVNRLTKTLARWRQLPEEALLADLQAMHVAGEEAVMARARRLFAEVQDLPAGLALQTLHSFAQGLLAGFPLEAGLTPGFTALDERDTQILRLQALQEAIAGAREAGQQWFLDDLGELALMGGEPGLQKIIDDLLKHRRGFETLRTPDAVAPLVERLLGVAAAAQPGDALRAGFIPGGEVEAGLRRFAGLVGGWGKTGEEASQRIAEWLALDVGERVGHFEQLRPVLLTKDAPSGKYNKALPKRPELGEALGQVVAQLLQLEQQESAIRCAELNRQALRVGVVLAERYERLKRAAGVIDYDDMIVRAAELLGRPGVPDWIKYKLDERFDHVLVDEAQDTNRWQWRIISELVEDYFADHERPRTLFVVGDMKQAIYRFQGTDPQVFQKEGKLLGAAAQAGGRVLRDVPLGRSFRSGPAVLDFVNCFLATVGPDALGLARPAVPHVANRATAGGEVVLWPLVTPPDGEESEEDADVTAAAARMEAARRIAAEIDGWLKPGPARLWLPAHGRFVRPGDILVLLRSRTHMMLALVEELHRRGVAVAGVDRLLLTEPLAVLDLIALMQFATQPEDDLNLANLLVSPFLGWREHEDIRRLPEGKSLWQRLRQGKSARAAAAVSFLRTVLNLADRSTPYEFLDQILSGPLDGRRQLLARLGSEAEQAIEALLNQALLFEEAHAPTLAGFLHWLSGEAFEVKRETGAGEDKVRLMTIHGAKGLEAPVVILADTGKDSEKGHAKNGATDSVLLTGPGGAEFPFLLGGKPLPDALEKARTADSVAESKEDLRLLYVALTRAADHLFIGGAIGQKEAGKLDVETDNRWHSRLTRVFLALEGVEHGESPNFTGELWRFRRGVWVARGDDRARLLPEGGRSLTEDVGLRLGLAPAVGALSPPLRPSHMPEAPGEGPATGRQRAAAERGRLMHRLFEKLPDVAAEKQLESARHWLLGQGVEGAAAAAMAGEVLAVLGGHPVFFAPGSLAEAPIAGIVGGQVVTGVVDRLLVQEEAVVVVDFKTGRRVPRGVAEVPVAHVEQMALYAAVLGEVFPGRKIVASLLYTAGPRLISLGEEQLRAALTRTLDVLPLTP